MWAIAAAGSGSNAGGEQSDNGDDVGELHFGDFGGVVKNGILKVSFEDLAEIVEWVWEIVLMLWDEEKRERKTGIWVGMNGLFMHFPMFYFPRFPSFLLMKPCMF